MIDQQHPLFQRFYPGNSHDKTLQFFTVIRDNMAPDDRVLNLGAGPGSGYDVCNIKGEVAEVVGADIDPQVLQNPEVDSAALIENDILPFSDDSFDLVFADFVVEHVENPIAFLSEIQRVLKPGKSFFFRTPNIWHYVALISRFTPHWFHELVANRARGIEGEAGDPYPTYYRLNRRRSIIKLANQAGFSKTELTMVEGHPSYLVFHPIPFYIGVAYERLVNSSRIFSGMRANIIAKLDK